MFECKISKSTTFNYFVSKSVYSRIRNWFRHQNFCLAASLARQALRNRLIELQVNHSLNFSRSDFCVCRNLYLAHTRNKGGTIGSSVRWIHARITFMIVNKFFAFITECHSFPVGILIFLAPNQTIFRMLCRKRRDLFWFCLFNDTLSQNTTNSGFWYFFRFFFNRAELARFLRANRRIELFGPCQSRWTPLFDLIWIAHFWNPWLIRRRLCDAWQKR